MKINKFMRILLFCFFTAYSNFLIAALLTWPFFSNSPVHDASFNVESVWVGIANVSEVYHFLNADSNLQVRYPVSSHDFPPEIRFEAYNFIDKYLKKND